MKIESVYTADSPFQYRVFIQLPYEAEDFGRELAEVGEWCRHTYDTECWTVDRDGDWYFTWLEGVHGWSVDNRRIAPVEFYFKTEGAAAMFVMRWL